LAARRMEGHTHMREVQLVGVCRTWMGIREAARVRNIAVVAARCERQTVDTRQTPAQPHHSACRKNKCVYFHRGRFSHHSAIEPYSALVVDSLVLVTTSRTATQTSGQKSHRRMSLALRLKGTYICFVMCSVPTIHCTSHSFDIFGLALI
jgi:hypothetical protein